MLRGELSCGRRTTDGSLSPATLDSDESAFVRLRCSTKSRCGGRIASTAHGDSATISSAIDLPNARASRLRSRVTTVIRSTSCSNATRAISVAGSPSTKSDLLQHHRAADRTATLSLALAAPAASCSPVPRRRMRQVNRFAGTSRPARSNNSRPRQRARACAAYFSAARECAKGKIGGNSDVSEREHSVKHLDRICKIYKTMPNSARLPALRLENPFRRRHLASRTLSDQEP